MLSRIKIALVLGDPKSAFMFLRIPPHIQVILPGSFFACPEEIPSNVDPLSAEYWENDALRTEFVLRSEYLLALLLCQIKGEPNLELIN